MSDLLLQTKLFKPALRSSLITRTHLIDRLNTGLGIGTEGFTARLMLVCAPAGFGKTTLVSAWLDQFASRDAQSSNAVIAWLSLDNNDNDPVRFLAYVTAALQTAVPALGKTAEQALQSPQPPPYETILTLLINDISQNDQLFILVLDDYHVIATPAIHQALTFLLEHLPPQLHLLLTSRSDPPLPLSRLRARGQVMEIRANDLRFTNEETSQFLNQVMGLSLDNEALSALEERTEGWIAGLQLAALSMQGRSDLPNFIATFTGSNRFILDYLTDEVLEQRPKRTKEFLLKTSILNRLCGPLCDAVTGQSGGQAILEQLEQANLFITPLDDENKWYRYHHLFVEVLRARLQRAYPDNPPNLHRRASSWYAQHGLMNEAVVHALAGLDFTQAIEFIEPLSQSMWQRGEGATLQMWLNALPNDLKQIRPRLALDQFWMALTFGQLETIEMRMQEVEEVLQTAGAESASLFTESIAMHVMVASLRQDIPRTIKLAQQALVSLPENEQLIRGLVEMSLGNAYLYQGDLIAAYQSLVKAVRLCQAVGNLSIAVLALDTLAMACVRQGKLHEAADLYKQALQIGEIKGQLIPMAGVAGAYVGLAGILHDWYLLDEAADFLKRGLNMAYILGSTGVLVGGYGNLARLLQTQGDLAGAIDATQQAERSYHESQMNKGLGQIEAYQARLWSTQGKIASAASWATAWEQEHPLPDKTELKAHLLYPFEIERLSLVRILLAQKQINKALKMLVQLLDLAEVNGHVNLMIESLVLKALAFQSQRAKELALPEIEQALTLAEPEGYIRLFVDAGEPMADLLRQVRLRGLFPNYVDTLLAAFPTDESTPGAANLLPDPLSERELEVLRLVATGASNQDIADQLFIALSTAKKHVSNMLVKLDTPNRTLATARARELGLLP